MINVMEQDIKKVLISEEEIQAKVAEIGARISEDYVGKNLLMVGILKGSVVFMADLMRAVGVHTQIDFMSVSSYGSGTKSSGVVKIIKDLDNNVEGYDLLLVEDILDSGLTLSYLREMLQNRHPNSIKIVTLLNKPARRTADIQPDYCCFDVPDEFVVGYGLDLNLLQRVQHHPTQLRPQGKGVNTFGSKKAFNQGTWHLSGASAGVSADGNDPVFPVFQPAADQVLHCAGIL